MEKAEFDQIKKKFEKETNRKKTAKLLNYISIIIASIGAVFISTNLIDANFILDDSENINNEIKLENALKKVSLQLEKANYTIDSLTDIKTLNNPEKLDNEELNELKQQVQNLNKVILEDPEKALSLPLLKKDLNNQEEQNERELRALKNEISRVYDINKWIIGLVFTMLVSIIVLNISNLYSKNKKET